MVCRSCGNEIPDTAKACKYCGTAVKKIKPIADKSTSDDSGSVSNDSNIIKRFFSKKVNIIITVIVAALVITGIVLLSIPEPERDIIYLDDYFEISFNGYDGFGTVEIKWDEKKVEELNSKYFDRMPNIGSNMVKGMLNINGVPKMLEIIDIKTSRSDNLSNGNKINLSVKKAENLRYGEVFTNIGKIEYGYDIKFAFHNKTVTVSGLTPVNKIDVFEYIDVNFSDINTVAHPDIELKNDIITQDNGSVVHLEKKYFADELYLQVYVSDDENGDSIYLNYCFDKYDDLSNGDTVKLICENYPDDIRDDMMNKYRTVIVSTEKSFTVSGLHETDK